jgi:peptidoglycan glycosyltransferase
VLPLPQSGTPIRNFDGETCGDGQTDTLAHSVTISCNTAFGQLGMDVGGDALRAQAAAFGFGSTVDGLGVAQNPSAFPAKLDAAQTAQSAIGQYEVRATPLQMAQMVAAIGNGGRMMRPHLVSELRGPDLKRISHTEPQELGRPVTGDVAAQLTTMMESVVREGTGRNARIPGVAVAGKTGTAQHAPSKPPHAWFVGFAPADAPKVAIAVIVQEGGGEVSTGGAVAAPIAQKVMQAALEAQR